MSLANQTPRGLGDIARERYDQMSNDLCDAEDELKKLKAELKLTIKLLKRFRNNGHFAAWWIELDNELARLRAVTGEKHD